MRARARKLGERAAIVLSAALGLTALGTGAQAEAAARTQVSLQAHVRLAGGYRLRLDANSYRGREQLQMSVGHLSGTTAQYKAYVPRFADDAGPRRLSAKLGERGSVAMQFEAETDRVVRTFGCDHYSIRQGTLRGRIRFRGEQRYIDVDRKRMHARLITYRTNGDCRRHAEHRPISLITCMNDGSSFNAVRLKHRSVFAGYGPERVRRGLLVYDGAFTFADLSDFEATSDLRSATLRPPFPFTGSAEYRAKELTGDLAMTTLNGVERPLAPAKAKIKYGTRIGITCSYTVPVESHSALPWNVSSGRNPIAAIP